MNHLNISVVKFVSVSGGNHVGNNFELEGQDGIVLYVVSLQTLGIINQRIVREFYYLIYWRNARLLENLVFQD